MIDEAEIDRSLANVPSSFVLNSIVLKKSKKNLESIISKLKKEIEDCVFDTDEEYVRDFNLLSYLYWALDESESALDCNAEALRRDRNNLIAAANKTWFYLKLNEPFQLQTAYENLKHVQKQHSFEVSLLSAQAEIAYNYTRLGFRQYEKAVKEFQTVLEKAQAIRDFDKNRVLLWKFGLGLTFRRLSHTGNIGDALQAAAADERMKSAIEILIEIIESDWLSRRCKGLSYVQLADAFFNIKLTKKEKHDYFPKRYCDFNEEDFYQKAKNICPEEPYILERYGKYLRTQRRLEQAEETLSKSVSIRPTSTAYHHLALTQKFKLLKELKLPPFAERPFKRSISSPVRQYRHPERQRNSKELSETGPRQKESHVRKLFPSESKPKDNKQSEQVQQKQNEIKLIKDDKTLFDSGFYSYVYSRSGACGGMEDEQIESVLQAEGSTFSVKDTNITESARFGDDNRSFDSGIDTSLDRQFRSVAEIEEKQMTKHIENSELPQNSTEIVGLTTALKDMSLEEKSNLNNGKRKSSKLHSGESKHAGFVPEVNRDKPEQSNADTVRQGLEKPKDIALKRWRNTIKSPIKVSFLQQKDTKSILDNLDKAIELCDNRGAKYDKGLILRSIKDFDGAIIVFKNLMNEETSLMYLANAYEQCAFCLEDKLQIREYDESTKKSMLFDQKSYFMKAIAVSAKLAAGIPNVAEVWASGITLKAILLGEGKTKENLKALAMLSERLKENHSAISYYEEIKSMDETEQKNPELLMKIVENQIHVKNYIEAVSLIEIVSMLPEGKEYIDRTVYMKALIEAGFQSIKAKHDLQIGSKYLKNVTNPELWLPVSKNKDDEGSEIPVEDEDEKYDIFVLGSKDADAKCLAGAVDITSFLKEDCLLNATYNLNDRVGGEPELTAFLSVIDKSNNIVIFVDKHYTQDNIFHLCIEHVQRKHRHMMLVLESRNLELPCTLAETPSLIYEENGSNSESHLEWMKKMFYKLSGCPL